MFSDPLSLFLGFPEQREPAGDTILVAADKGKGNWNLPVEGRRAWGPGGVQLWEVFPLLRQAWGGRVVAGPREGGRGIPAGSFQVCPDSKPRL